MSDMKRTITPNDPADFTPTREPQIPLQPFRYWCQKVLPLVYDDSLSYYDLLCKVVDYLNKTTEDVTNMDTDMTNLYNAYNDLQSYVNNYFSTLDVQAEINNKLDAMVEDGTLSMLFNKIIIGFVYPEMFGAKGDGITDDTSAINDCLNYAYENNYNVNFNGKSKYLVSSIIIPNHKPREAKKWIVCGNFCTLIASTSEAPLQMESSNWNIYGGIVKEFNIDMNNIAMLGVLINGRNTMSDLYCFNMPVNSVAYKNTFSGRGERLYAYGNIEGPSKFLEIAAPDCKFDMLEWQNCQYGIDINGYAEISRVHGYIGHQILYKNSYCIKMGSTSALLSDIYVDTQQYGIILTANRPTIADRIRAYFNTDLVEPLLPNYVIYVDNETQMQSQVFRGISITGDNYIYTNAESMLTIYDAMCTDPQPKPRIGYGVFIPNSLSWGTISELSNYYNGHVKLSITITINELPEAGDIVIGSLNQDLIVPRTYSGVGYCTVANNNIIPILFHYSYPNNNLLIHLSSTILEQLAIGNTINCVLDY